MRMFAPTPQNPRFISRIHLSFHPEGRVQFTSWERHYIKTSRCPTNGFPLRPLPLVKRRQGDGAPLGSHGQCRRCTTWGQDGPPWKLTTASALQGKTNGGRQGSGPGSVGTGQASETRQLSDGSAAVRARSPQGPMENARHIRVSRVPRLGFFSDLVGLVVTEGRKREGWP